MYPLTNIKPSIILVRLARKARLSNKVSREALASAVDLWQDYVTTPNKHRDAEQVKDVANQLRLIITQVKNGCTRINPSMWSQLVQLEGDLRTASQLNILLELNSNAANDSANVEVA